MNACTHFGIFEGVVLGGMPDGRHDLSVEIKTTAPAGTVVAISVECAECGGFWTGLATAGGGWLIERLTPGEPWRPIAGGPAALQLLQDD